MLTSADTEHNTYVNAQQRQFLKECTLKLKILLIYSGVLNTPINSIFFQSGVTLSSEEII